MSKLTETERRFIKGFPRLRHFKAREFLNRGGSNKSGRCAGKNTPPPLRAHRRIYAVAVVWDEVRRRLGKPITTLSVYRSPAYNRCVGEVSRSQHMLGTAADATSSQASAQEIYDVALQLRREGFFKGGIGLYRKSNFVHIDVRGSNATWRGN